MFLLRAGRSQPGTAHGGPPDTGSPGSKVSTPARNSGRMLATSFSSSPCVPAGNGPLPAGRAHRVSSSKTSAEIRILTPPRVPAA
jgi:hypothetical protein